MKLVEKLKKNYKEINVTLLCICIYLVFIFPIVSIILEKISPVLTKCPYLQITGKPCPLCGGTRFLKNIKNAFYDITYIFNFFGIVIIILLFEILFRMINIRKKEYSNKLIKFDIVLHIFLGLCYNLYIIWFITK